MYKIGMKKRSLLILLERPQTVEALLKKSVLQEPECLEEIQTLLGEGFISLESDGTVQSPAILMPAAPAKAGFYLVDDIILSEAKFLLVDFCVDHFGTHSKTFVDEIRTSVSLEGIRKCLDKVAEQVERQDAKLTSPLLGLVREINDTA